MEGISDKSISELTFLLSFFFFFVVDHDIQVYLTSSEITSFIQLYLTNLLVAPDHTPNMASETSKENVCVRESLNSISP